MKASFRIFLLLGLLSIISGRLIMSMDESTETEGNRTQKFENPFIINQMTSKEAHAATIVPDFKDQQVYSGFVQVKDSGSSMYFISYSAQKAGPEAPMILWLQGGPGASSWAANLGEMGPYSLKTLKGGKYELVARDYTWNESYHLLFIDNPFGAGYSYASDEADYVTNEDQVAENLYTTLTTYFAKFPEYATNDFFIFGESYAGHYIPAASKYILEQNEKNQTKINLKGVGIGDGWTDPIIQLQSYGFFGVANALIDQNQYEEVKELQDSAVQLIKQGKMAEAQKASNDSLNKVVKDAGNIWEYNYRYYLSGSENDQTDTTSWFNLPSTRRALHIPEEIVFSMVNQIVYNKMTNDFMTSMKDRFPFVLEKIPVMLYNGQDDLICNAPGSEAWISTIDWPHRQDYLNAKKSVWKNQDGEIAGYERSSHGLVQVIVLKAGHMVPADQPKNAQNLVDRFIKYSQD